MILLDANLLIHAWNEDSPLHKPARTWLDAQFNSGDRVGLPWRSLIAFVRIVSNPRVFAQPPSVTEAWEHADRWLDVDTVWIPEPTWRHRSILAGLLQDTSLTPALVPDAHLAALAMEHGLTLCSTDRDFARFPGLKWTNPLASN